MSKELEALKIIKKELYGIEAYRKPLEVIETALKNYVEMTNTPPILLGKTHGYTQSIIDYICKNYKEVKITNLEDEKKTKAFEIIKKKRVNIQALFYSSSCEDYNKHYNHYEDLTQKEYDLLKEVLKNE